MVSAIERFQCIKILFLRKWHNSLFFICFLIFYRNYDVVCRQNLDDVTLEQVMVQTLDIIGKRDKNFKCVEVLVGLLLAKKHRKVEEFALSLV